MSLLTILAIAVALALDALAVSIATGAYLKDISFRQFFRLSFHFGLFQAMMPAIGWSAGIGVKTIVESYAPYIAFFLLLFVSGSMVLEAFKNDNDGEEDQIRKDPTKGSRLVILSVATSIDALSVGFSLSLMNITIVLPVIIIGFTAMIFTIIGMYLGSKSVKISWLHKYSELIGAAVLFSIGVYILIDHGVFSGIG